MGIELFRFMFFPRVFSDITMKKIGIMIPWFFEEAVGSWWSKLVSCRFFFVSYITTLGWNQNMIVTIKVKSLLISSPCVLIRTHHDMAGVLQCYQWLGPLDLDGLKGLNRTWFTTATKRKLGVFQTSWTRNPTKDVFQGFQILFQNIRSIFCWQFGEVLIIWRLPNFFSDVFSILLIRSIVAACDLCVQSRRPENPRVDSFEGIHDLTAKIGRWFFSYSECPAEWNLQNWVY